MGLLGSEGGERTAGECTMKGRAAQRPAVDTRGPRLAGERGGEGGGAGRGKAFPHRLPLREEEGLGTTGKQGWPWAEYEGHEIHSPSPPQESDDLGVSCSPHCTPSLESQSLLELLTSPIHHHSFIQQQTFIQSPTYASDYTGFWSGK